MSLAESLKQALAPRERVSESEARLRNGIPDAQTLPARAVGYSWGVRDENERLAPLHAALINLVEIQVAFNRKMSPGDDWFPELRDGLARLKGLVGE